jgi:cytochrome c2
MLRQPPAATVVALALVLVLPACDKDSARREATDFNGHPKQGAKLIANLGCGICHSIPGIDDARGRVGPPLAGIADRTVIAGMLPNTPRNMIAWLRAPQSVVPGNVMPNMELDDHDARDIAAYLYTLR